MASQRHNDCKLPPKCLKNRIPLADHFLPKNRPAPQTSVKSMGKKTCSGSKLPVPIGRKIPGDGLFNFKGLSLTDASVGTEDKLPASNSTVDAAPSNDCAAVATEAKALTVDADVQLNSNDACLKLVKHETDLPAVQLKLDDEKTFEFYKEKLANFRGADLNETVREIGQQLISDEVLRKYSYLGRREKLRFKVYDNLTKLVVASTIESIKQRHFEIHGKVMVQSVDEATKLHGDVEKYFTTEYIRKAETRFNRSTKYFPLG